MLTPTPDDQEPEVPLDAETELAYQYEIRGAMDSVIRYCRDTVREHSSRGFWTPPRTPRPHSPTPTS